MWFVEGPVLRGHVVAETVVSLTPCLGLIEGDMGWATRVLIMAFASLLLLSILLLLVHRRDRRLYAALDESTEQQKALISNLPGAAFRCSGDGLGTVQFISDEIERLSGYRPSDFNNSLRRLQDLVHPEDRDAVAGMIGREAATGRSFEMDMRFLHKDGSVVWVHVKGRGSFDSHRRLRWIDGVLIDISQRRQVEAERERLITAIEQADEIIQITDMEGTIVYVNPAFERITGYTRKEAVGQNPRLLKSGQQSEAFYHDMWHTLADGRVWNGRIVNRRKDGTFYTEQANITPVRDEQGQIVNYVAVKRDVTSELELEYQRQQARKMESVSRLAGGMAHGFNNMLQAILGHTEIALKTVESDHPLQADLESIRNAAHRSTDLTRQLLTFGRKQAINPEVLDVNQAVANTLKLLPEVLGKHVSIVCQPARNAWRVAMDPVQVDQILVNLCLNARDAIKDSGTITIGTRNVRLSEQDVKERTPRGSGDYVALSVRDDGSGMDEETQSHMFEPFFSTKEHAAGSAGMGLAIVYGVVQQNQGFIDVESQPGHGSEFTIYVPRILTAEPEEEPLPDKTATTPAPEKRETILLVEDEPAALHVCRVMLENEGYRVLTADHGDEAMELARRHAGEIDLLLTDVIMPETNGYELAQQIQRNWPDIKCMFMSGYTADIIVRRGVVEDGLQFIQKPFTVAALTAKVRATLDQRIVKIPVQE